jgi:Ca-activated chloride channel family protein
MVLRFVRSIGLVALLSGGAMVAFQSGADSSPGLAPRMKAGTANFSAMPAGSVPVANLRIDTELALIPVHVTTNYGTPVTGLKKENFCISEDGVEQTLTYFSTEDAPLTLGVVFDGSGSMSNKMKRSVEAAEALFRSANMGDEFFLVEFGDRPKVSVPMTTYSEDILKRIHHIRPFGRTSLYDAIHLAIQEMKKAHNPRKALVVLSDGGDNRSRHTFAQIKNILLESDIQVYAMGIFDRDGGQSREERNGPRVLADLAELSGGRHFDVNDIDELPEIGDRIGREIRNQYVLGYSPTNNVRDGRYRRVSLKLVNTPETDSLRVLYRTGYYAPSN